MKIKHYRLGEVEVRINVFERYQNETKYVILSFYLRHCIWRVAKRAEHECAA